MTHARAKELLDLTRARLLDPLPGSAVARLLSFIDRFRGASPSDEGLLLCAEMGRCLLRTKDHAYDSLSRALVEAGAGLTQRDIPNLDEVSPQEIANLAKAKARNTKRREYRDRGRPTRAAVMPNLHGARCVALAVHRFGTVPSDFGIDGPGEEILLSSAIPVFLQDTGDPTLESLVRRRAIWLVSTTGRPTDSEEELLGDVVTEYLMHPPDYRTLPALATAEDAWTVLVGNLKAKLSHLRESSRRPAGEPPARTLRYRKQKGIRPEDLASPEATRSAVALELGVVPNELSRLEKRGLLKPTKKRNGVEYDTEQRRRARQLVAERRARRKN